jgi:hypothetical protein
MGLITIEIFNSTVNLYEHETSNPYLNFVFDKNQHRSTGRAVAQWFTAAARVRVRAACGVCGGQSRTGAGFLRVLRFPLPIIPPISPLS